MLTGYIHVRDRDADGERGSRAHAGRSTTGAPVDIILSNSSDKPIYEQISSQIKANIMSGELASGEKLPSIRSLASGLRVSVITTKRAYSDLEAAGFIETVQGKGSFVAAGNREFLREEGLRRIEGLLDQAVSEAVRLGVSRGELHEMLDAIAAQD